MRLRLSGLAFAVSGCMAPGPVEPPIEPVPLLDPTVLSGREIVSVSERLPVARREIARPERSGLAAVFEEPPRDPLRPGLEALPEPSLTTATDIEALLINEAVRRFAARGTIGAALDDIDGIASPTPDGAARLATLHPGARIAINVRVEDHTLGLRKVGGGVISTTAPAEVTYGASYSAALIDLETGTLLGSAVCEETVPMGSIDEVDARAITSIDIAAIALSEACGPRIAAEIFGPPP